MFAGSIFLRNHSKAFKVKVCSFFRYLKSNQPALTCSKLTVESLEQGVKYVKG